MSGENRNADHFAPQDNTRQERAEWQNMNHAAWLT
jgi:hypothetical protein